MLRKFQGLSDEVGRNSEALAALGRQLRSIYDAYLSRPSPSLLDCHGLRRNLTQRVKL
jgi:hypothetical protein